MLFSLTDDEVRILEVKSKSAYKEKFNNNTFYCNYIKMMEEIYYKWENDG